MSKKSSGHKRQSTEPSSPSNPLVLSPTKRRVFRWLAAFGLPLLILFLLELGLRLAGWGYPTAFFVPSEIGPAGIFRENQRFGWRFFPRALARAPDPIRLSKTKSPGTCRIFLFGESAALGDPEPAYGFSRILEEMLKARFPGTKFEVINVAMTAISSHVILRIARDCVPFQGDIWIFYMGNNEVVGPFGAGSVFGAKVPPRWLIRTGLITKSTRLGQFVDALFQRTPLHSAKAQHWEGMKMMLDQEIRSSDPVLHLVYDNFGNNLEAMLTLAHNAGVKTIVSSVTCNLKDCPPFASLHRPDLPTAQVTEWERLFAAGNQMQSSSRYPDALVQYRQAIDIDSTYAALPFRMAQCYEHLGDAASAQECYLRARDLDTLRFRVDSAINGISRFLSTRHAAEGVRFFNSETVLTNSCKLGIPGEECFWDHVHYNFSGNYQIARGLADQVISLVSARLQTQGVDSRRVLTQTECAEHLAFTDWDRRAVLEQMWRRVQEPPFSGQMGHQELVASWAAQRASLDKKLKEEGTGDAIRVYRAALAQRADDWLLHHRLGFLLESSGDFAGAEQQWRQVIALVPDYVDALFKLGDICARQSRSEQAIGFYQEVLRIRPHSPEALNGLGLVHMSQNQTEQAVQSFAEALKLDPGFAQADVNWGLLLTHVGKGAEAESHYRKALTSDPASVGAHLNLANLLANQKRYSEAVDAYQAALKLQPADATIPLALGNAFEAMGRSSEAILRYRQAIELNPALAEAHFNCGVALAKSGDLAGATSCFQQAARLRPEDPQAHLDLGVALAKQSRFTEAIAEFQSVLRLDPQNDAAARYLQMAKQRAQQ